MSDSADFDVIVIGGGTNGLVAACTLADAGLRTAVIEASSTVGGIAAGREFAAGFRSAGLVHDTRLFRRWVADDLDLAGHGLRWSSHPGVLIAEAAGGGPGFVRSFDPPAAELAHLTSEDRRGWRSATALLERAGPWLLAQLDRKPPAVLDPGPRDLLLAGRSALGLRRLGRRTMSELLRALPMPVGDWVSEHLESDLARAALASEAVWSTALGPRAPGTNANLLLAEAAASSEVAGGPAAIAEALASAAAARRVDILTASPVRDVRIETGRVVGVTIDDGRQLQAPRVVATCDPRQLFGRLIQPEHLGRGLLRHVRAYRCRGRVAKLHLALDAAPEWACRPDSTPRRLRNGTSLDQLERGCDAAKYRGLPESPLVDIFVPTIDDPGLAPEGKHVLSVIALGVPEELDGGWTEARPREALRAFIFAALEALSPGLRERVLAQELLTPAQIRDDYRLPRGDVHHGEQTLDQLLVRPIPEAAAWATPVRGLYLCGSGSHPGGGVTGAPGALGARALLAGGA